MTPTIEYNGYVSISQQVKKADFMNADDLRNRYAEGYSFRELMIRITEQTQTGWI